MFNGLIKSFCYKVYSIGMFEQMRRNNLEKKEFLAKSMEAGADVFISSGASIINDRNDPGKIRIGRGTRIWGDLVTFHHGGEIIVGEDCFVGPQTRIWSAKSITIGNRVLIAHNVNVHDNISHPKDWQLRHDEYVEFVRTGIHKTVDLREESVTIEDDAWIGFNSTILKGVRIGRGAIIGAGSMVLRDVEPWTVNVGNPLRCIERLPTP